MKGVDYLYDQNGKPKAVLIDLKRNSRLWEDIFDILVARERMKEPRIPFDKVKSTKKSGKKA